MAKALFIIIIIFLLFPLQALAIYDPLSVPNNKFGIHILEPNEIEKATELVNSSGGDWGYVTIPIRANDRDLDKWVKFMNMCREKRIIPILRIATFPLDGGWAAPNEYDLIDFANFLNELPWPIKNRYIIVYNEPNHQGEWGGFVYPQEYARVFDRAVDIFKAESQDYFMIIAGMDAAATDSPTSANEYRYFRQMASTVPAVFTKADGLSSHSYGNPDFSSAPNIYSRINIAAFRYERDFICRNFQRCNMPIFITEAGWSAKNLSDDVIKDNYLFAWRNVWQDEFVVAVTPFIFDAREGPFSEFSFVDDNFRLKSFAENLKSLPKVRGSPIPASINDPARVITENTSRQSNSSQWGDLWIRITSFFTRLLL